jgi:hypothetical protein
MKCPIAAVLGLVAIVVSAINRPAAAQDGQWGSVKGRIIWGGKDLPIQQPIAAVKNHMDAKACTMDGKVVVKDEMYVVNPANKGLRWTFVWLTREDLKSKAPLPIHPDLRAIKVKEVEMDQPLCAFAPHALAMREGQTLVAKNSAKISHSFKWTGKQSSGNVTIPAGGSLPIKDLVADKQPIQIECALHLWMKGAVLVFDHPYFAVSDADGGFALNNAPAGTYRLMVRHSSGIFRGGAAGRNAGPGQYRFSAPTQVIAVAVGCVKRTRADAPAFETAPANRKASPCSVPMRSFLRLKKLKHIQHGPRIHAVGRALTLVKAITLDHVRHQ